MKTHFQVREFIRNNPEWAVAVAYTFFVNEDAKETEANEGRHHIDAPTNIPLAIVYVDTHGDIQRADFPVLSDNYNCEFGSNLVDLFKESDYQTNEVHEVIEDCFICTYREALRQLTVMDKDLASMIDVDVVGEDEFGTRALQISVKDDVNTIAMSYVVNRRMLKEIYDDLV